MQFEHDLAGELLRELRSITSNYTAPADSCVSYKTLYEALGQFEQDLHLHIHLENNILFPRAIEMESKVGLLEFGKDCLGATCELSVRDHESRYIVPIP